MQVQVYSIVISEPRPSGSVPNVFFNNLLVIKPA